MVLVLVRIQVLQTSKELGTSGPLKMEQKDGKTGYSIMMEGFWKDGTGVWHQGGSRCQGSCGMSASGMPTMGVARVGRGPSLVLGAWGHGSLLMGTATQGPWSLGTTFGGFGGSVCVTDAGIMARTFGMSERVVVLLLTILEPALNSRDVLSMEE